MCTWRTSLGAPVTSVPVPVSPGQMEALERLAGGDVRYRFVLDLSDLDWDLD